MVLLSDCPPIAFIEQDARGIWTAPSGARVAWLKNPDGNILSLTETRRS